MVHYKCVSTSSFVYLHFFIILPVLFSQNAIYVLNTEDNDGVEYYDCIMAQDIPYCQRPEFPDGLRRDKEASICHHEGKSWTFDKLRERNQTVNRVIHKYRSSMERAEEYSLFLTEDEKNGSLCECVVKTFGKNCEYKLIGDSGHVLFTSTRKWQNTQKKSNRLQTQAYKNPLCYTTMVCDYGLLCLDWRDICDGRQQCINGTDEEACDLLEFNECEEDEYRCSNGMCISDVYFLDGEYDCMDHSDERKPFPDDTCAYEPNPFDCDEHICAITEWSCGDGQCIPEENRYEWDEFSKATHAQCHSMREYMFMCELSELYMLWTGVNGTCYSSFTVGLIEQNWHERNQTAEEYCLYLVKCALLQDVKQNCSQYIREKCPKTIQYPEKGLLTPYLVAHYNNDRKWSGTKQPDFYTIQGSIRCHGYYAQTTVNQYIQLEKTIDRRHIALDHTFCEYQGVLRDSLGPQFHPSCYSNLSRTFGKRLPYAFIDVCKRCISQYRIRDGTQDCVKGEDERTQQNSTCSNTVSHHRYRCFLEYDTCLLVRSLGDSVTYCNEGDDESNIESGDFLSLVKCEQSENDGCPFLRNYISQSNKNFSRITSVTEENRIPFRYYCNTFWDFDDKSDESTETCRSWKCPRTEFQCATGQCVSKSYICDGEWDCNDASDELFDFKKLSDHNQMLDLKKEQTACTNITRGDIHISKGLCDTVTEYPCLLANFTQTLTTAQARPCISIKQIGDNKIDCVGGLDERNTLTRCNGLDQLGFAFQCRSEANVCIENENLCVNNIRCSDRSDDLLICRNRPEGCSDTKDFVCINGSCVKNVRCDGKIDCTYGEDEYWCHAQISKASLKQYRAVKRKSTINSVKLIDSLDYPLNTNQTKTTTVEQTSNFVEQNAPSDMSFNISSFICNRGIAASHYTNAVICFCPPSYYGQRCEYHSDRITSYVHLNLSHTSYTDLTSDENMTIKVLVLLMHENQVIHSDEFYSTLIDESDRIVKAKHFLLYSRKTKLLQDKINRRSDRASIANYTSYYLRYEAYELKVNSSINLIGVWQYPIYFDFLPSFRLAKALLFRKKGSQTFPSPCESNPCNFSNAECHILQNDPTKYVCLCKSGHSGEKCSIQEPYCTNSYCHSNALCKPGYMGTTAGIHLPFCLCPLNVYGTRCGLVYDQCWSNPCKNNGTCYPNPTDLTKVYCKCDKDHDGANCNSKRRAVDVPIQPHNMSGPSVTQLFYVDFKTLGLILVHQNLLKQIPDHVYYVYTGKYAPNILLLKIFSSDNNQHPQIFLLSLKFFVRNINSSSALEYRNLCVNVKSKQNSISPYQYHNLCHNGSSSGPLCFFDDQYLCFCDIFYYRTECFLYNHKLDQCDQCFSNGRCIRGDLRKSDEYLCICPKCHYGYRCEFSMEAFGFTLESLIVECSQLCKISYATVTFLFVIIGTFSNFCSFVTFKSPTVKSGGVGHFLFTVSCINPLVLFILFVKFMQITLKISDIWSCKILSYSLSVLTRSTLWMTSWITASRLFIIIFPTSLILKNNRLAMIISVITMVSLLGMHVHEIIHYTTIHHIPTGTPICIPDFNNYLISNFNRITTIIHYVVPFSTQMICISYLIILVARSRVKTIDRKKTFRQVLQKQFQTHKEHYIAPTIMIISALPQIILAFSLLCVELSAMWRHMLLVAYLLSYLPQQLGFILFVLPSTVYMTEFRKTWVAQKFFKRIFLNKQTNATGQNNGNK